MKPVDYAQHERGGLRSERHEGGQGEPHNRRNQSMALESVTFSQVVAKAHEGAAANEGESEGFGGRQTPLTRPEPVSETYVAPSDRNLATQTTAAIAELQDAMEAATKAGLIVEPEFKSVSGRFNEFGVSVDSHMCSVQIYRKLS